MSDRVKVVTLVGSSRFMWTFRSLARELAAQGVLALAMPFFDKAENPDYPDRYGSSEGPRPSEEMLERIDRRRVELCDEVLVVNLCVPRCPVCKAWYTYSPPWHMKVRGEHDPACDCHKGEEWRFKPHPVEEAPYVGEATRKEIEYARSLGRPVRFLIPEGAA